MEKFKAGEIVAIKFPFSDLSSVKLRPALILADVGRNDYILAQITSKSYLDNTAIIINSSDFSTGALPQTSYVRPGKLFTANVELIVMKLGTLTAHKHKEVVNVIFEIIKV